MTLLHHLFIYRQCINKKLNTFFKYFSIILPIPVLLLIWELVSRSGIFNAQLFPPPTAVWRAFMEMLQSGQLLSDFLASARRAVVGYTIGCVSGVAAGVVTGRSDIADRFFGQIIHLMRSFPPVAIVPLAITWFGLAETSKYFLVFWGVFFPVWVNAHAGMSLVDEKAIWAARCMGAQKRDVVRYVILPAALPHILAGMRVAIGICFICVFVAEMAGAYEGVGFRISVSNLIFRVDKMIAALIVLGAMGAVSDTAFKFTVDRLFPWTKHIS